MPGSLQEDGQLGYCWMHHFKCHSARTCYTWAAGGPITEDKVSEEWQEKNMENIQESQDKIKKIEVEGISGGDRVKVLLNGDGEMIKLYISPEIMQENKEIVEDLIIAAHGEAKKKLKSKTSEEISKATGGFGLPGFKWPI